MLSDELQRDLDVLKQRLSELDLTAAEATNEADKDMIMAAVYGDLSKFVPTLPRFLGDNLFRPNAIYLSSKFPLGDFP